MALLIVFEDHICDKAEQFPVWLSKTIITHIFLLLVHCDP